jgi:hypothetical protein
VEAKRRGTDEQVVLPGHCLKDLAEADGIEVGTIQAVRGFGLCRAHYVGEIVLALKRADVERGEPGERGESEQQAGASTGADGEDE